MAQKSLWLSIANNFHAAKTALLQRMAESIQQDPLQILMRRFQSWPCGSLAQNQHN